MGYADPETIRMLCCVSKQFYDLITNDPGMENNRAIPLLQISPSEEKGDVGRLQRLLKQLNQNQNRVQHIRAMKVITGHKFGYYHSDEVERIRKKLRLYGVVSLDLSSPTKMEFTNYFILTALRELLPNLREINLSNTDIQSYQLEAFGKACSLLKKITYNHNSDSWNPNNRQYCGVNMDGNDMSPAKNLREIYMDDSNFYSGGALEKFSSLENDEYSDIFLFHKCSKGLERVSIKNAKNPTFHGEDGIFSQNVLIKFVRNTPTLKWLRSDLTQDNIEMLQSEQEQRFSKIEFVQ